MNKIFILEISGKQTGFESNKVNQTTNDKPVTKLCVKEVMFKKYLESKIAM